MVIKREHPSVSYDVALAEQILRARDKTITGTSGDDHIVGTDRTDLIDVSQGGNDFVDAGADADKIYFGAALTAADFVDGGLGNDNIVLEGDYREGLTLTGDFIQRVEYVELTSGNSYTITIDSSLSSVRAVNASRLGQGDIAYVDASMAKGDIDLTGGAGDDILMAGRQYATLRGGNGNDTLVGGSGWTFLIGGRGSDTLTSQSVDQTRFYYSSSVESTHARPDLILGFRKGNIILLDFDADVAQDGIQKFHFGETPGHAGDLTVHYNAKLDLTIIRAFTNDDAKADMEIHLQGHVPLTPADFGL